MQDVIILAVIPLDVFTNFTKIQFMRPTSKQTHLFLLTGIYIIFSSIPLHAQSVIKSQPVVKRILCRNGAVVSANSLASLAGIRILKAGGNAVDAAIATQLALAVVYPGAGNLGGGGFMVAHLSNQKNLAVDFRD
jgi:gamma-glutamyltranspeptidase/glutathione hydrolase